MSEFGDQELPAALFTIETVNTGTERHSMLRIHKLSGGVGSDIDNND